MIPEFVEKYNRLSGEGKKEYLYGYVSENLDLVKDANAYELVQNVLDYEKKIKEAVMTKEKIKEEIKKEEAVVGTVVKEGGELAETSAKNSMVPKKELTLVEWEKTVKFLYDSGYFTGLQNPAQALAKAQCGRELGFTPFYSLQHIFIIPGKPPAVDGQAMGALIKSRGYDYRPMETTDKKCMIKFFGKKGEEIGIATFTIQEAEKIVDNYGKPLSNKKVWRDYPTDMLWWRALSRGGRRFCPDAISGVYYIEELDYEMKEGSVESDLSAFKIEAPKTEKASPNTKVEKTRKEMLGELVKKHTKEKLTELKDKMKIDKSLLDVTDVEWNGFVKRLEGQPKEKVKEKKKKEVKEIKENELSKAEKLKMLEGIKDKYSSGVMKKVKEKLKLEGKLVDLSDKEFGKFTKAMDKEEEK